MAAPFSHEMRDVSLAQTPNQHPIPPSRRDKTERSAEEAGNSYQNLIVYMKKQDGFYTQQGYHLRDPAVDTIVFYMRRE